jgi:hypothetical protein
MEISGVDVGNAYLESAIHETIFMRLPPELGGTIVQLQKCLYGLKQAGAVWNANINQTILDFTFNGSRFQRSIADPCVYIHTCITTSARSYVAIYVDDAMLLGKDKSLLNAFKAYLAARYKKISDLGYDIQRFLGIDISRDRANRLIHLSQRPHIEAIATKFLPVGFKTRSNPADPKINLRLIPQDPASEPLLDRLGSVRYLADKTRPDILAISSIIGTSALHPSATHSNEMDRIISYLHTTQDLVLTLGGPSPIVLTAYVDASYVEEADSLSQLGYCLYKVTVK